MKRMKKPDYIQRIWLLLKSISLILKQSLCCFKAAAEKYTSCTGGIDRWPICAGWREEAEEISS